MNKSQGSFNLMKVYSKDYRRYILVVLLYGFISMDQIEKQSCILYSASNGAFIEITEELLFV